MDAGKLYEPGEVVVVCLIEWRGKDTFSGFWSKNTSDRATRNGEITTPRIGNELRN